MLICFGIMHAYARKHMLTLITAGCIYKTSRQMLRATNILTLLSLKTTITNYFPIPILVSVGL